MDGQLSPLSDAAETIAEVPAFLVHKFGSRVDDSLNRTRMFAAMIERAREAWRGHLQWEQGEARHLGINIERGLLSLFGLLAILSCIAAVAGLMRIRSLESDLVAMHRELGPMKERIAKLGLIAKARAASDAANAQKNPGPRQNRTDESSLQLSSDEIQLIRDYIKPAPANGAPSAGINVGDPLIGSTVPFPSLVTEKIPKLLGARFAIKNGAIVISGKGNRQIELVLQPN